MTNNLKNKKENVPGGWSWGGSFATLLLFIGSGSWGLVILYVLNSLLLAIPIINVFSIIGELMFFLYGGLKGKEIVYNSSKFVNHKQRIGAINLIERIGYVFFWLMLLAFLFLFLFSFLIALFTFI